VSTRISMKSTSTLSLALLAFGLAGCMSDQTRNMADTCNQLLQRGDREDARNFITDARKHLASLKERGNKVMDYIRDVQDPDADSFRPALEQCLWLLESRQS